MRALECDTGGICGKAPRHRGCLGMTAGFPGVVFNDEGRLAGNAKAQTLAGEYIQCGFCRPTVVFGHVVGFQLGGDVVRFSR